MKMKNRFDDKIYNKKIYNGVNLIYDGFILLNKTGEIFITWLFDTYLKKWVTLTKDKIIITYNDQKETKIYYNYTEEEYFQDSLVHDLSDIDYNQIKEAKEYYEYVKNNCYFIDEL